MICNRKHLCQSGISKNVYVLFCVLLYRLFHAISFAMFLPQIKYIHGRILRRYNQSTHDSRRYLVPHYMIGGKPITNRALKQSRVTLFL